MRFHLNNFKWGGTSFCTLACFWLTSCGDLSLKSASSIGTDTLPPNVQQQLRQYEHTTYHSELGSVEAYQLTGSALNQALETASLARVYPAPIHPNNGSTLYAVGEPGANPLIFVSPSILIQTNLSRPVLTGWPLESSEVRLNALVSFVNGLTSKVGEFEVPTAFLISSPADLFKSIEGWSHFPPKLMTHAKCPNQVTLKGGFGEIPLEFNSHLSSCPINEPISAQLSLSHSQWEVLMESIFKGETPSVQMTFDLSVPVVESVFKFLVSKSRIIGRVFEGLDSNKSRSTPAVSVIEEVTQSLISELFGDETGSKEAGGASKVLYERVVSDLKKSGVLSDEGQFSKRHGANNIQGSYEFATQEIRYVGEPLKVKAKSNLFSVTDSVRLLIQAPNSGSGKTSGTFMTVKAGDMIQIHLDHWISRKMEWPSPKESQTNQEVCIQRGPSVTHEEPDLDHCLSWNQVCSKWESVCHKWQDQCTQWQASCHERVFKGEFGGGPSVRRRNDPNFPSNCYGVRCVTTVKSCDELVNECRAWQNSTCKQYALKTVVDQLGDCLKSQNQWSRTTVFSTPSVSQRVISEPFDPKRWDEINSQIELIFSHSAHDEKTQTHCKLSDLKHQVLPDGSLVLILKNTESCTAFVPGDEFIHPKISVLSQLSLPVRGRCGTLWENFEGKRTYRCQLDGVETIVESSVEQDALKAVHGEEVGIFRSYEVPIEIKGYAQGVGFVFDEIGETRK